VGTVLVRIDLDHNATTRLDPRVREAMLPALMELYGNPSSIHEEGRRSRDLVERARADVARLVGGAPSEITFTSGGTESDVLGVVGAARAARAAGRPARLVTSRLEHPAVLGAAAALAGEGFEVVWVDVDARGRIAPAAVAAAVGEGAALVSLALANHELGNVYDVAGFVRAIAGRALVHCDAVQAAGKLALDVRALGVDLLTISAHKLHGPKGAGALWVRRGVELAPGVGGHQERGWRAGTENVPGIVGFGAAARLALDEGLAPSVTARVAALRDRLEAAAVAAGARVHGDVERRVGNTTNVAFAGVAGDLLVQALDLEGVAASTGAACTSGTVEPSPVIRALGVARREAAEAVRLSLGRDSRDEEIARVSALLPALVARIRAARA
jgi:cysteine desulfurase